MLYGRMEAPISRQLKWYRENMTPERRERKNQQRREYYQRHREAELARNSERYYAKKAAV